MSIRSTQNLMDSSHNSSPFPQVSLKIAWKNRRNPVYGQTDGHWRKHSPLAEVYIIKNQWFMLCTFVVICRRHLWYVRASHVDDYLLIDASYNSRLLLSFSLASHCYRHSLCSSARNEARWKKCTTMRIACNIMTKMSTFPSAFLRSLSQGLFPPSALAP